MEIVIDGYNLLSSHYHISLSSCHDLEQLRDQLNEELRIYKSVKKHTITIIYDGWENGLGVRKEYSFKGIKVIFTKAGEQADSLIKVYLRQKDKDLLLVSSDRDLINCARQNKKETVSSSFFSNKLSMANYCRLKGVDEEAEESLQGNRGLTKKKGQSRRLSKDMRKSVRKMNKL